MIYTDFVSGGETIRMFENLIKSTLADIEKKIGLKIFQVFLD